MPRTQWLEALAATLGVPAPTDDEVEAVLQLAGDAAHASERTAAPLSAWLVGRAGRPPGAAVADVQQLAERIGGQTTPDAQRPPPVSGTG